MMIDQEALIANWMELQTTSQGSGRYEELILAAMPLSRMARSSPEQCYQVVLEIARRTSDDFMLSNLAAGLMEDLLANHGEVFASKFLEEAKKNPNLARALRMVWHERLSDRASMLLVANGYRADLVE